jgi:hypothetical protein
MLMLGTVTTSGPRTVIVVIINHEKKEPNRACATRDHAYMSSLSSHGRRSLQPTSDDRTIGLADRRNHKERTMHYDYGVKQRSTTSDR